MLPLMLSQALCLPWETALNFALRHDPATLVALAPHSGKLVCVRLQGFGDVHVRLLADGVSLSVSNEAAPDVILAGRSADFLPIALAGDKASALMASPVVMEGDTRLATALSHIASALDIDWEAMAAPLTGGLVAHQLGQGLRGLMQWGQQTSATMMKASSDYVQDEVQWVTSAPLLERFARDVDQLRLRADRLSARIERLEQARPSSAKAAASSATVAASSATVAASNATVAAAPATGTQKDNTAQEQDSA